MGEAVKPLTGIAGGSLGSLFSPNIPKAPPLPPPPPPAPTEVSEGVISARQKARRKSASLASATNLTGGLTNTASTSKKTLLGV